MAFSLLRLAAVLISMGFTEEAIAQGSNCKDILSQGIWDIEKSSSTSQYRSSFVNWFCSQNFSSEGSAKESGGSLGLPIDDLPIEISGSSKSSNWKEYYSSACSNQEEFISKLDSKSFFSKTADAAVIAAWDKCSSGSLLGLTLALTQMSNPAVFKLRATYSSVHSAASAATDSAILRSISIQQASASGDLSPVKCSGTDLSFDRSTGITSEKS